MTTSTRMTGDTGRIATVAALLVSLVIAIIGCWIGASAIGTSSAGDWAADSIGPHQSGFLDSFIGIIARNAAASALLFSGVVTLGISAVLALGLTSAYVGATFAGASAQVGVGQVIGSIWWYAPLEFGAVLMSAAAGLLPLVSMLQRSWRGERTGGWFAEYSRSLGLALRLFAAALVILVLAAAVEAAVVTVR